MILLRDIFKEMGMTIILSTSVLRSCNNCFLVQNEGKTDVKHPYDNNAFDKSVKCVL